MADPSTGRSNRRLTARHACQLTVRYRSDDDWHPATAMDLAANGCRLRLGEELARGTAVSVVFELPLRDGSKALTVEVPGTVIWSRIEGLSRQAGIQFPAPPDALQELIDSLR
jgi:hypothetical protein